MSKELKGKNGKIVGTMEYFDKLNESCVLGKMVKKYNFNYYSSIKDIGSKTNKMFDEVCSDLRNNEKYLSYIDKGDKKDTIEILKGMADLCKIIGGSISGADKCISLLDKSDKSKSGASDSDVTKSAKFVLSNKYFNKKDSIKVLEDCIRNGVNKATKSNANKEKFMKEVVRSSKSGYLEDVLIKVNYLDSGKKITGKCGKVLCSKEYNNHIANAVTGGVGANGSVEYGKAIRNGLKYVATKLNDDLDKGNSDNDYIQDENANNLIKFIEELAKCGRNNYNLSSKVMKLAWFKVGDVNKILKLQKKLNAEGIRCDTGSIVEDGVYSKIIEEAWSKYIEIKINSLIPPQLKLAKYAFDNYNFVVGYGVYGSGHIMAGGSTGIMLYIDDDYNVAIIGSTAGEATTDVGASVGVKGEISFDADTVNSMSGGLLTYGVGIGTPIVKIGVNGGYSRSFDGKTTSYSGGASFGGGLPVSISTGISGSKSFVQFNPVEWIKKSLNIK